jgi:hypothetical protein
MLSSNMSQDVVGSLADLSQAIRGNADSATSIPLSPQPVHPSTESATVLPLSSPNLPATDVPAPVISTPTLGETAIPLPTSFDTVAPRPTHLSTSTPGAPFELANQSPFCEPNQPGLLQVSVQDSNGKPVAGVELVITWLGGEEHFFTGLKPELGNGYADFAMTSNVEYALSTNNGPRVTGLVSSACTAPDGSSYPGGIRLEFKQH